ncbi:outer membrane beta-barrel protein [Microbulbifer epialgicus]|uniref:Outer membrane beta-barrel protein n=1 Tax=Microbulbifer epialgicus TaxID=393907 RepID=A0ABV4P0A8_9GAMM
MKTTTKTFGALTIILSSSVFAEGGYWGATAGVMDFDFQGVDNPMGLGLRAGYSQLSGWGLEAEYIGSLVSGEIEVIGKEVDVDMHSLAGYATYRSFGDIYFKGRLGLLYEDITVGRNSGDDFGVSVGAGVGFILWGDSNIELEYTILEKDVEYWSGAFSYRF